MRVEPGVDALDVESVAALGQQPESLGGLEPAKADGALESFLLPTQRAEAEHGQGLDDGAVDAGVPPVPAARATGARGPGAAGAPVGPRRLRGAALAVLGVEQEEERDGEDAGDDE